MSEDLSNEIEAINSIYGEGSIVRATGDEADVFILSIPRLKVQMRLVLDSSYPEKPPQILGTHSTGESIKKGYGAEILAQARDMLSRVFFPGTVCLFDLMQGLEECFNEHTEDDEPVGPRRDELEISKMDEAWNDFPDQNPSIPNPEWVISEAVTLKKSTFIARACPVSSPAQAHAALAHLLANDKRAAKATHNINAYRIRSQTASETANRKNEITYQDCDDDGEMAAGSRLLHLLQIMDVWNVFVVVTRWYGGIQLGPDRFRIISQVAREAVVRGGCV